MFMISSGKYVQKDMGAIVTQQILNQTARSLAGAFLGPPIRTYCTMSGFPHLRHTSWGVWGGGDTHTVIVGHKKCKRQKLACFEFIFWVWRNTEPIHVGSSCGYHIKNWVSVYFVSIILRSLNTHAGCYKLAITFDQWNNVLCIFLSIFNFQTI